MRAPTASTFSFERKYEGSYEIGPSPALREWR
jgi:hypothetical protein